MSKPMFVDEAYELFIAPSDRRGRYWVYVFTYNGDQSLGRLTMTGRELRDANAEDIERRLNGNCDRGVSRTPHQAAPRNRTVCAGSRR